MNFIKHYNLEGCHAPFSASQPAWIRYSDDKLIDVYENLHAKEIGTRIHEWAKETILLGMKQPKSKKTISSYINDAIGYHMTPEVVLFYSLNFFGTADAICFKNNLLRIHDLKTGKAKAKMEQLYVYVAFFCLEYKIDPYTIEMELRIYQSDDIQYAFPTGEEIKELVEIIQHKDKVITTFQQDIL